MVMKTKTSVFVYVGSRANYATIRAVLHSLRDDCSIELSIVAGTSAVLPKYGQVSNLIRADGFTLVAEMMNLVEGDHPQAMVKTAALLMVDLGTFLASARPHIAIVIGDRYEMIAVAVAAKYQNILVSHVMGGEESGTIDDYVRHALTSLSDIHLVASQQAAVRVQQIIGPHREGVHLVGCPRIDTIRQHMPVETPQQILERTSGKVGSKLDLSKPFVVALFHPVTNDWELSRELMENLLYALDEIGLQTLMLWPNADSGGDLIAKAVRSFRESRYSQCEWLTVVSNFEQADFITILKDCMFLIGNSSAGIRDCAFLGVPAVNIGSRQQNRERGINVFDCNNDTQSIIQCVLDNKLAIEKTRVAPSNLYGDGFAGPKIRDILKRYAGVQ